MAQVNNVMKFFQFLSEQCGIKSSQDMIDAMDNNGDGYIVKSELKAYMKNWEGNFTDTELNQFWKAVDTKTSGKITTAGGTLKELNALDDKEMENMDALLGAYNLVNEELEGYIADLNEELDYDVKALIDFNQLASSVKESVGNDLSSFIKSAAKKDDFEDLLAEKLEAVVPKAINKTVSNLVSHALLADTIKQNPALNQLGYQGGEDFEALINTYIGKITEESELATIVDDIKNIVNDFVNSAITGEVADDSKLVELGYNTGKINTLQTAVLKDTLTRALTTEVQDFKKAGLEADYNKAIQNFIQSKMESGLSFNELKALGSAEFQNSKEYKSLEIRRNYADIKVGDGLYNKIVSVFNGHDTIAKAVAERDVYNAGGYKDIVAKVAQQVANGDIEPDKAEEAIIDGIIANLSSFVRSGNLSIKELGDLYDDRAAAANTIAAKEPDAALKQHRQAALDYCNAVATKNSEFKGVIDRFFGGDYVTQINSMYPDEIKDIMSTVKAEFAKPEYAQKMVDPKDYTMQWNNVSRTPSGTAGSEISFVVDGKVTNKDGSVTISAAKVIYSAVATPSGATVEINESTGEVKITASKEGNYAVTVTATVNGVAIGTKDVDVTVKKPKDPIKDASWGNATWSYDGSHTDDGNYKKFRIYGCTGLANHSELSSGVSFDTLYNGNAIITLHFDYAEGDTDDGSGWQKDKNVIEANLGTLCNNIVTALSNSINNVDTAKLKQAATTVKSRYLSYTEVKFDANIHDVDQMHDRCAAQSNAANVHQVVYVSQTGGKDDGYCGVSFKNLVDDILAEYKRLIEA